MTMYDALLKSLDDLQVDDREVYVAFCEQLPIDHPRKKLMELQLALEVMKDEDRVRELESEIEAYLNEHEVRLLGELASQLMETYEYSTRSYDYFSRTYRRGFLDSLSCCKKLTEGLSHQLINFPEIVMLRELTIFDVENGKMPSFGIEVRDFWDGRESPALTTLAKGNFPSLRTFEYYGEMTTGVGVERILERMPKLEVVRTGVHSIDAEAIASVEFRHLRELDLVGFLGDPLTNLAMNSSFTKLESLQLSPRTKSSFECMDAAGIAMLCSAQWVDSLRHLKLECTNIGDEGIHLLAERGVLGNLKTLELDFGAVTDRGVETIIEHGQSLQRVTLDCNYLSEEGARSLRSNIADVEASDQHTGNPEFSDDHLLHHRFDLYG